MSQFPRSFQYFTVSFEFATAHLSLKNSGAFDKEFLQKIADDKQKRRQMFKGFMMVLLDQTVDEDTQVNGFVYVEDFTGYTMQHMSMMDRSEIKDLMRWQVREPKVKYRA